MSVFNRAAALDYVGHDIEFLRELLTMLRESRTEATERIAAAIENNDSHELREAAHRLKGMLGTFYSIHAAETAEQLEQQGKAGSLDSAADLFSLLDRQIDELCEAVNSLVAELE